ncbi:MAG: class I tRNA ligase family protein [Planctomycetota bacterium]
MTQQTHPDGPAREHAADDGPAHRYNAARADDIERRWQSVWADRGTFVQPNPGEEGFDASRPKFYCLDMFPYPSGAGLHVGHPEGYTATDIICRYKKMSGFNVLHPMGWDAFGLPAEQYAIQTGVHPAETTRTAIDNFRRQLQRFGFCYDWSREFATIDEDYYRWTQWVFVKIYGSWFDTDAGEGAGRARPIEELVEEFESGKREIRVNPDAAEHDGQVRSRRFGAWASLSEDDRRLVLDSYRLAYLGEQTVNWCPKLGTALANEEVIDGKSERGGYPVFRKPLRQWMFRITAYGTRLLDDLPKLDWPESTRTQQAEWIGRSEGAEVSFELVDGPEGAAGELLVYTTRPDTLFGATYMVVAPEHPLIEAHLSVGAPGADAAELMAYVTSARNRTDVERQESKEKTGVFTGIEAINPLTGDRIPVWCSDYVLMGYGSGAIMAVPAHDERDFEFARAFGLPILDVVLPRTEAVIVRAASVATPAERDDRHWAAFAADLLGLMMSDDDAAPSEFNDRFDWALHLVRTRRSSEQVVAMQTPGSPAADVPGAVGMNRGTTRVVWLDALEELGAATHAATEELFAGRQRAVNRGEAYAAPGVAAYSVRPAEGACVALELDGLATAEAKERATSWLEDAGLGRRKVNYKLRDWLFSRQRYWGEPFPIVFDENGHHHAVSEDSLPVALPALADYQPVESDEPVPLLGKATDWVSTTAGEAGVPGLDETARVTREVNTMPGWAGSCWYYLRYCSPGAGDRFVSLDSERYWMLSPRPGVTRDEALRSGTFDETTQQLGGVDLYVGGAEHAVLHLLYARFWHKVLFDLGEVSTPEPFHKMFHQGLITSYAYQRADRSLVPVDEVEERDGAHVEIATGEHVTQITAKMSKSLRNVVNPDDVIAEFGADTFRLYEMYMGPLEQSKPWDTRAIGGMYKFLQRLWRVVVDEQTGELKIADATDERLDRELHRAVAKVGDDIERLAFNTAIAAMIELVNSATQKLGATGEGTALTREQIEKLALIACPFAPHLAEEVWAKLTAGTDLDGTLASERPWPGYDPAKLVDDEVEIAVQLKGKVKARVTVPANLDQNALQEMVLAMPEVAALIDGLTVRKVIAVPGRLVNIVAT